jgi:hypothetical protein
MQGSVLITEDHKNLFCSSDLPSACERISSKFIDNLGTLPQKGWPALLEYFGEKGNFRDR